MRPVFLSFALHFLRSDGLAEELTDCSTDEECKTKKGEKFRFGSNVKHSSYENVIESKMSNYLSNRQLLFFLHLH